MPLGLSRRRLSSVGLAVLAVSLLVYFGAPVFTVVGVPVDTATQEFTVSGWVGGGGFDTGGGERELLDATRYITSWKDNGDSEKLDAQAAFHWTGDLLAQSFRRCRYFWYLNTGLGWQPSYEVVTDMPPIQEVGCDPRQIQGDQFVQGVQRTLHVPLTGGVRVDFEGYIGNGLTGFFWSVLARDEASLVTGLGDVWFDRGTYEVGEEAVIRTCVGFSSSSGNPWTVQLHGPETDSWNVPDNVCTPDSRAILRHTFQMPGQYRVILLNGIQAQKDDDTAVVDDIELAPVILGVTVTPPGRVFPGDELTVEVTAAPNPATGLPIEAYYFHVRQGPNTVIVDRWQASNQFVFTVQGEGDVQVNVCIRDAERSACSSRIDIVVNNPDKPWGTFPGIDVAVVPIWTWVLIGVLLMAALGVQFLPQIPAGGRNVVSLLSLGAVLVLLMVYVVLPAVEAFIRSLVPGVLN